MEKRGKPPYYKKIYPEASAEVIAYMVRSDRKMQHMEYDIKVPKIYVSRKSGEEVTLPPLEVSLNVFMDMGVDFQDDQVDIEQEYIDKTQRECLYEALDRLPGSDLYLIVELFFRKRSEQDVAKELHVCQNAIHKRKKRILRDLRKSLDQMGG